MSEPNNLRRRSGWAATLLAATCLLSLLSAGVAGAHARHHAHSHLNATQKLRRASHIRARADRALVRAARRLRRCERHRPGHCASRRRALQRAGTRLSHAQRHIRRLARVRRHRNRASLARRAPRLYVSGSRLYWSHVHGASSYVVERGVPGQPADYSVRITTSWTPPAVPGVTVRYRVRTNVGGSQWSSVVSISYPAAVTAPPAAPSPAAPDPSAPDPSLPAPGSAPTQPPVNPTTAPSVTVSGQTLSWDRVGNETTYVVVATTAGQADQYSEVTGTGYTPPAVPGATVKYSVRTAVDGSAWSVPVSITYPAPVTTSRPATMAVGVNGANYGTAGVNDIKNAVHYVRLDQDLGATALHEFEDAGMKIDLDFSGPYNSNGVSGLNASSWVSDRLAFYKANTDPSRTPYVEVLNEPGGTWFWGSNAISQTNADAYRSLVQQTYDAFHAAYGNSAPKILATFDGTQDITFGQRWWTASAANFVDGIVVHPYGGTSDRSSSALGNRQRVIDVHNYTGKPVYVTEVGWPTAVTQSSTSDSFQWSEADQATNLTNFMDWARSTGYVPMVMYFNYHDFDTKDWYGVVRGDGSHKPSYYALQAEAAK